MLCLWYLVGCASTSALSTDSDAYVLCSVLYFSPICNTMSQKMLSRSLWNVSFAYNAFALRHRRPISSVFFFDVRRRISILFIYFLVSLENLFSYFLHVFLFSSFTYTKNYKTCFGLQTSGLVSGLRRANVCLYFGRKCFR